MRWRDGSRWVLPGARSPRDCVASARSGLAGLAGVTVRSRVKALLRRTGAFIAATGDSLGFLLNFKVVKIDVPVENKAYALLLTDSVF